MTSPQERIPLVTPASLEDVLPSRLSDSALRAAYAHLEESELVTPHTTSEGN